MARVPPLTPRALRTRWALAALRDAAERAGGRCSRVRRGIEAMGLVFPGPVGLAAGFDRHGALVSTAQRLGLGAVEIGTVSGRSYRLRRACPPACRDGERAVIGVSIAKRAATPWSCAEDDFVERFRALHRYADYVTLTPGRACPPLAHFARIVTAVARARDRLAGCGTRPLPLVVKVPAAWLAEGERVFHCAALVAAGASGLLLCTEGCSRDRARAIVRDIAAALKTDACILNVGGIDAVREARARLAAGARLVQLHRAATREGPRLLHRLERAL